MRLSEWRAEAPDDRSMGPKVRAAMEPVLTGLGAEPDPSCWVVWGGGVDADGARVTSFAIDLLAGLDGRSRPSQSETGARPSQPAPPALPAPRSDP